MSCTHIWLPGEPVLYTWVSWICEQRQLWDVSSSKHTDADEHASAPGCASSEDEDGGATDNLEGGEEGMSAQVCLADFQCTVWHLPLQFIAACSTVRSCKCSTCKCSHLIDVTFISVSPRITCHSASKSQLHSSSGDASLNLAPSLWFPRGTIC